MTMHSRDEILSQQQAALAAALSSADEAWPPGVLDDIVPGGTLDRAAALGVYRTGYVVRLTGQLGETYRTVWRAVGDDAFFALCADYIGSHRSSSYNLSDYGRELPDFLEQSPLAGESPFLADLARLDLAYHDLFHAEAHEPVAAHDLASIGDLAGVRLELGSAVRLLSCDHAVRDLFVHRHDDDDAEPPSLDGIDRPQWLVLFRRGTEVVVQEIGCGTFAALAALAAGEPIDAALEHAAKADARFTEQDASKLFETIAANGLVAAWSR